MRQRLGEGDRSVGWSPRSSPAADNDNITHENAHGIRETFSEIKGFVLKNDGVKLKAEVWVETVTGGGRRFMAAWRKE